MDLVDARLGAWLAVSALLIVTPGPDTALVIRNALRSGARAASHTAIGVGAGSLAWGVASVLGVAVLLERSAGAFTVLKLVGAAYLVYLGLRSLVGSSRRRILATDSSPQPGRLDDRTAAFRQGLLNNLLNPKAGAIFVTVMPQFISRGDPPARFVLMMLAYEAMVIGWLAMYGFVVSRAKRTLSATRLRQTFEQVTGVVLIALGVRLAFERR